MSAGSKTYTTQWRLLMSSKEWQEAQRQMDKILIRKGINPVTGKRY